MVLVTVMGHDGDGGGGRRGGDRGGGRGRGGSSRCGCGREADVTLSFAGSQPPFG